MSVRVMAQVWDCGGLRDATLVNVLVVLANSADDDGGNCFPGLTLIGQRTRYSKSTVIRAIADLERDGWIRILQRGSGRPAGKTAAERAHYKTQYQINVAKLKECQGDTFSEPVKRVSRSAKKVSLGVEKGVTDAGPLFVLPVLDPSENHPPAAPALEVDMPLTPEQLEHLERCAANPVQRDQVETWRRYYCEENRIGAEKAAEAARVETGRRAELARIRKEIPDVRVAVRWVLRKCGWVDRGRAGGIGLAVQAQLLLAERAGRPPWETAPAMAQAWLCYAELGDRLQVQYGPVKFIELGIWGKPKTWRLAG